MKILYINNSTTYNEQQPPSYQEVIENSNQNRQRYVNIFPILPNLTDKETATSSIQTTITDLTYIIPSFSSKINKIKNFISNSFKKIFNLKEQEKISNQIQTPYKPSSQQAQNSSQTRLFPRLNKVNPSASSDSSIQHFKTSQAENNSTSNSSSSSGKNVILNHLINPKYFDEIIPINEIEKNINKVNKAGSRQNQ